MSKKIILFVFACFVLNHYNAIGMKKNEHEKIEQEVRVKENIKFPCTLLRWVAKQVILLDYKKGIENALKFKKVVQLIKWGHTKKATNIISEVDENGRTLLHSICRQNDLENLKKILPYCEPKTITLFDKKNKTPLYLTCKHGDNSKKNCLEIAKLLLPFYTSITINQGNRANDSAIWWASWNGDIKLLKILVLNGASFGNAIGHSTKETPKYTDLLEEYHNAKDPVGFILEKERKGELTDDLLDIVYSGSILDVVDKKINFKDTVFYNINEKGKSISFKLSQAIVRNNILRADMAKVVLETFQLKQ